MIQNDLQAGLKSPLRDATTRRTTTHNGGVIGTRHPLSSIGVSFGRSKVLQRALQPARVTDSKSFTHHAQYFSRKHSLVKIQSQGQVRLSASSRQGVNPWCHWRMCRGVEMQTGLVEPPSTKVASDREKQHGLFV